ncbi:hypothetical protein Barb6XT_01216 [Bacteroidales bacterium Barb6XT]|nr:hypothetical protein Barb6XT_01216 [Bacteroidales bacterium Barb6XT]
MPSYLFLTTAYLILTASHLILTAGLRNGRHRGVLQGRPISAPHGANAECGVTGWQRQGSPVRTIYSFILSGFHWGVHFVTRRAVNPTFRSAPCGAEIGRPCRTPPCRPFRNTVETQCIASLLHGVKSEATCCFTFIIFVIHSPPKNNQLI